MEKRIEKAKTRQTEHEPITDAELREVLEYCEAATEGPLIVIQNIGGTFTIGDSSEKVLATTAPKWKVPNSLDNARFFAHSRTDLPRLTKALQAMNARVAEHENVVDDATNCIAIQEKLYDTLKARVTNLETLLKVKGIPCDICWTTSWAPCEESDEGAVELKGNWVVCQQCQVEGWNRGHRARVAELEKGLRECETHETSCSKFQSALPYGSTTCDCKYAEENARIDAVLSKEVEEE